MSSERNECCQFYRRLNDDRIHPFSRDRKKEFDID
jgi:hypothetical protein